MKYYYSGLNGQPFHADPDYTSAPIAGYISIDSGIILDDWKRWTEEYALYTTAKTTYDANAVKFNTAKAIKNNEETYRNQANIVFKALFERTGRENKELYPMAALLDEF